MKPNTEPQKNIKNENINSLGELTNAINNAKVKTIKPNTISNQSVFIFLIILIFLLLFCLC